MPIATSTLESWKSSAMLTEPRTSLNRPRTLVTMKCRPVKATSACPGSISHRPAAGRTCPSNWRVGADEVVLISVMVLFLVCD